MSDGIYEIGLRQRDGQERLESKLELLTVKRFDCLDLALVQETITASPDKLPRVSLKGNVVDAYAATGRQRPVNIQYYLAYTLQPSGETLPEHRLGDMVFGWDVTRFDEVQYCILANVLRKILGKVREKEAKVTIAMPFEDPRELNDAVVAYYYKKALIAELRPLLEEEYQDIPDEDVVPVITTPIRSS